MFKSSLVCAVIDILNGKRYLDFSAGWGDRLVGAIAKQVELYVGVDPNTDLKEGHDAIISTLAADEYDARQRYRIVYQPFQKAILPEDAKDFDLVFTSPPYFDFEIYTKKTTGQSIDDYPDFEQWLISFLLASIRKAWSLLKVGGHLAIHIADTREARCCEIMNLFILAKLKNAVYEGVIASRGMADRPRPIWVFRKAEKLSDTEIERQHKAEQLAKRYFNRTWRRIESDLFG